MCECCEKIEWCKQNKGKNDELFSKIVIYGWRDETRKVIGMQVFSYETMAYKLNYCPMCGRKLGE